MRMAIRIFEGLNGILAANTVGLMATGFEDSTMTFGLPPESPFFSFGPLQQRAETVQPLLFSRGDRSFSKEALSPSSSAFVRDFELLGGWSRAKLATLVGERSFVSMPAYVRDRFAARMMRYGQASVLEAMQLGNSNASTDLRRFSQDLFRESFMPEEFSGVSSRQLSSIFSTRGRRDDDARRNALERVMKPILEKAFDEGAMSARRIARCCFASGMILMGSDKNNDAKTGVALLEQTSLILERLQQDDADAMVREVLGSHASSRGSAFKAWTKAFERNEDRLFNPLRIGRALVSALAGSNFSSTEGLYYHAALLDNAQGRGREARNGFLQAAFIRSCDLSFLTSAERDPSEKIQTTFHDIATYIDLALSVHKTSGEKEPALRSSLAELKKIARGNGPPKRRTPVTLRLIRGK